MFFIVSLQCCEFLEHLDAQNVNKRARDMRFAQLNTSIDRMDVGSRDGYIYVHISS